MPAKILLGQGEVPCHTRNISKVGLLLETDAEVVADNPLDLIVLMPGELLDGEDMWMRCKAKVLRMKPVHDRDLFEIAACIESIEPLKT